MMLMLSITVLLIVQLPIIKTQPRYETLPLRFDLAIARIRQHQNIDFDDLPETLSFNDIPNLLSSFNKINQCDQDFERLLEHALERQLWAIKVIDAWGKPLPSAILKGNGLWTGNYDECVQNLYDPQNKTFLEQTINTQFCTIFPSSTSTQKGSITLGICVPTSCDRSGVVKIVRDLLKHSNLTEDRLVCSHEPHSFSVGAIVTTIILSLLGLLVILGTCVDVMQTIQWNSTNKKVLEINEYNYVVDENSTNQKSIAVPNDSAFSLQRSSGAKAKSSFLAEFSALRTLRRIFSISTKKNDEETMPFLNGIRVLALFWVIVGHSIVFTLLFCANILDLLAWTQNLMFQLVINAVFSVDTFFVLSGFLTTVLFVRQVNKEGKLSFRLMILYYIHRYIRLTPTFLLVVLMSINLTPYFGHGPVFPSKQGFETAGCRNSTWWTSILYVGNLVRPDDMCLPISWYLHNDMQFHWIAPLALIPFVLRRKPIGFVAAVLMTVVGIISTLAIVLHYPNLSLNSVEAFMPQPGPTFFNLIYIKPWCRISPYAIGVLTGFFVTNIGRTCRMNEYLKHIGTLLATLIGLLCLFGVYQDYIQVPGLSRASLTAYQVLSRTAWALSISWLIFLCSTNQGGVVNKILSWPVWTPFARLNYSAYLIHTIIIDISILNQIIPSYLQTTTVINSFIAHIVLSYLAAILVYMFFETPFFLFEKKLLKRG